MPQPIYSSLGGAGGSQLAGNPGVAPGGGGGGGAGGSGSNHAGGNGANGQIRVTTFF